MKKRVFLIILALILTALPACAQAPDRVADLYNDHAAVFAAPKIVGDPAGSEKFIKLHLENGDFIVLSQDQTFVTVVSSDGETAFRAAVSILCALADGKNTASIISGTANAFLMLDGKLYTAGPFSCSFEITAAGEFHFSAIAK